MTAVEWLEIEIKKQIFQCETQWQCGYQNALNKVIFLLKQTKEMEKQQIKDAFDIWFKPSEFEDGEQYYKGVN